MQEYSQQLASAIKRARLDLGLTQEQVAEKSGTDVRTIIIAIQRNRTKV